MSKKTRNYTLKDVASIAGVSVGTVSNYLNNPRSVKEANQKLIQSVIDELHFTPNINAKILATGKSHNIVLYILSETKISPTTWLHQLPIVQAVHDTLEKEGYTLQIRILDASNEKQILDDIISCTDGKVADGLIILSVWKVYDSVLDFLLANNFPYVCLDNYSDRRDVSTISFDNYSLCYSQTKMLYDLGHRDILFIYVKSGQQDMLDRYRGYCDAFKALTGNSPKKYVMYGDFSIQSGKDCVISAIENGIHFTAVLAGNDNMAVGAIQGIAKYGFSVPKDVSIVGVDNSIAAMACIPRLQTAEFDLHRIGVLGADLLLKKINDDHFSPRPIVLKYSFVAGDSLAVNKCEN